MNFEDPQQQRAHELELAACAYANEQGRELLALPKLGTIYTFSRNRDATEEDREKEALLAVAYLFPNFNDEQRGLLKNIRMMRFDEAPSAAVVREELQAKAKAKGVLENATALQRVILRWEFDFK